MLREVSNITAASYINALADGWELELSPSTVTLDLAVDGMSRGLEEASHKQGPAIVFRCAFLDENRKPQLSLVLSLVRARCSAKQQAGRFLPNAGISTATHRREIHTMARVLIVDDAAFMRLMLKKIIVVNGHEVVGEAGDGDTAIEQYRQLKPDLVTLDITMPGKDGLEVLQAILQEDSAARIVMCSALGQQAKVVESMKLGAKDFVVKPFEADTVKLAIDNALAV